MPSEPKKPDARSLESEDVERTNPFNPLALFFIALLIVGGWYMIDRMRGDSKMQDCIQSGKRNCAQLEE